MLTLAKWSVLPGLIYAPPGSWQPLLQHLEIHRLRDELRGSVLIRTASSFIAAVSRHHHDRQFWPAPLDFAQQRQTVHSRHVDVGQDDNQLGIDASVEFR